MTTFPAVMKFSVAFYAAYYMHRISREWPLMQLTLRILLTCGMTDNAAAV